MDCELYQEAHLSLAFQQNMLTHYTLFSTLQQQTFCLLIVQFFLVKACCCFFTVPAPSILHTSSVAMHSTAREKADHVVKSAARIVSTVKS